MSDAEDQLFFQCRACGLPTPQREYRFHPLRRWRADLAFPEFMLLVEVEGGVWINGRHTSGAGYSKDIEKYNATQMMGYRLLRFTPAMVMSGEAIASIQKVIGG